MAERENRQDGENTQSGRDGYKSYNREGYNRYNRNEGGNNYGRRPRFASNNEGGERPQRSYNSRYNNNGDGGEQRPYRPRFNGGQQGEGGYRQQRSYGNRPSYDNNNGERSSYNPNFNNNARPHRPYNSRYNSNNNGEGGEQRSYRPRFNNAQQGEGGYRPQRPRFNNGGGQQGGYNRQQGGGYRPRTADYNPNAKYSMKKQIEYKDVLTDPDEPIRLNKFLANAGICSRREADEFITAGVVSVNGVVVTELGTKVKRTDEIKFHDQPVNIERKVYVLLNKPKDCVTTSDDPQERKTVMDFVKGACKERIYPVGRLDKDSEGLLLLTNQGDLVNRIMRAGNYHEKEYEVTVDKKITETFIRKMSSGVPILGTVTRPCTVYKTGDKSFSIILTQGLNRQIRRMCEYLGYHVCTLKRIRIMNLTLDGLKCGEYREICGDEWKKLNELIRDSSSETVIRTGGQHGNISGRTNKRTGAEAERSGKGILSGRPGDHEQQRVRRTVRSTGKNGKGNRNRSGRQPNC